MRKALLTTLFAALAAASASADLFWYDVVTNYPLGAITTNTAIWYPHLPGGLTANDAVILLRTYTSGAAVTGRRLSISGIKSEYIMRLFDPVNTNAITTGTIYASFVANANFVPGAGQGTYFATFNDLGTPLSATNGFNFRGRVFEIGTTNVFPFTNTTPSTFRYGVANGAGDPAQGGGPSILYVPIDLIRNVDYQVVLKYVIDDGNPADAATATIWVNPASESDTANMAGPTSDAGAVATGLAGLLFRQRTGGGTVDVRDIAVGTNFTEVMTNLPGPVMIATNYNTVTNYSGNPGLLEVFASSIGGGVLSYQWYQIAGGVTNAVPGANSQVLLINSLSGTDTGNYFCAITNSGGIGALSRTNFYLSVNATPTPPTFTRQPTNTSISVGSTLTMAASAFGTGPLSYQWYLNGTPLVNGLPGTGNLGDISVVSGAQSPTLSIALVSTNEDGNYTVTVTGGVAPPVTSTNAAVTVTLPATRTIAYLRSLLNTTTWQPTDTSTPFTITGVITTTTNLTSGNTSSYYIQDSTAGINLFVTGDSTFRPHRGDVVTASGTLSSFNNSLELACNALNPYQFYHVLSNNLALLPAPYVFYPPLTNNAGLMETNVEGRFVMMTNVFFPTDGMVLFPSGGNVIVTNQAGVPFIVFISSQCAELIGQPMPTFAWSVLGAMAQFQSGNYSSAGYELNVTSLADIITNPPPPVTVSASLSGNHVTLNWTAVPYSYSYSVLGAANIAGPYLPVVTGLTFTTSNGAYTDTLGGSAKFYKVVSP
jgi:hypothetical protein